MSHPDPWETLQPYEQAYTPERTAAGGKAASGLPGGAQVGHWPEQSMSPDIDGPSTQMAVPAVFQSPALSAGHLAQQREQKAVQDTQERAELARRRRTPVDENDIVVVPRECPEPEKKLDTLKFRPPPRVRGVMIETAGLEMCLLTHQYQCCVRLGKQRGSTVSTAFKKTRYSCMNWDGCPFCLNVRTPLEHPERSFLEVTRPHVHEEPTERKKATMLSELSRVIRRMYAMRSQDIQKEVAKIIRHCLSVPDIIGLECERLFPQYPIPKPVAYRLGDLLPSKKCLNARRHLVRKSLE